MLKQRIITAIVLVVVFAWATFGWTNQAFEYLLFVVAAIGAWEWSRLGGLFSTQTRVAYTLISVGVLYSFLGADPDVVFSMASLSTAAWLGITFHQIYGQAPSLKPREPDAIKLVVGIFLLVPVLTALNWLHHSEMGSAGLMLYMLCIVWAADIGAYFAGRRFGKNKLAPNTSPGKTWEGVAGGLVAVFVLSIIGSAIYGVSFNSPMYFIFISLLTGCISVVGDLFESRLKREMALKDSSQILPGHGGVLDRIDSVLAAAPVFVFLLSIA